MNIFDIYGKLEATYLHGNGEHATDQLFGILPIAKGQNVLEFGCGVGASLVKLFKIYGDSIKLHGVDSSQSMIASAVKRLKYYGIEPIKIELIHDNRLPYPDAFFDKIYCESVLAIQDGDQLQSILKEFYRILKPHGLMGLNESIWELEVPLSTIDSINSSCKELFDILQCNASWRGIQAMNHSIAAQGFRMNFNKRIEAEKMHGPWFTSFYQYGVQVQNLLSKKKRKMKKELHQSIQTIPIPNSQFLVSYILLFEKV